MELEIQQWQQQFEELGESEVGARLIQDDWVVRYYFDQWGNALPDAKVADNSRTNLNTLVSVVQKALATEGGAYTVDAKTVDSIDHFDSRTTPTPAIEAALQERRETD